MPVTAIAGWLAAFEPEPATSRPHACLVGQFFDEQNLHDTPMGLAHKNLHRILPHYGDHQAEWDAAAENFRLELDEAIQRNERCPITVENSPSGVSGCGGTGRFALASDRPTATFISASPAESVDPFRPGGYPQQTLNTDTRPNAAGGSAVRPFVRLRGRSFMAVVLMPDNPVETWLEQLDAQLARSPKFFDGRAVMLDFTALAGQERSFPTLLDELKRRHIRIMGVEGVDPNRFGDDMPPVLAGGRHVAITADEPPPAEIKPPEPISLVVSEPVRSGQSINFPGGDVTIVGSVASGSEIVAGGSIHVYGTLRGRAIAGLLGAHAKPRIFCRKLDAELLAIDGVYRTADEIDPALQGRAVQAWLEGDEIRVAALD